MGLGAAHGGRAQTDLGDVHGGVLVDAIQPRRVLAAQVRRDGDGGAHAFLLVRRQVCDAAKQLRPVRVGDAGVLVRVLTLRTEESVRAAVRKAATDACNLCLLTCHAP